MINRAAKHRPYFLEGKRIFMEITSLEQDLLNALEADLDQDAGVSDDKINAAFQITSDEEADRIIFRLNQCQQHINECKEAADKMSEKISKSIEEWYKKNTVGDAFKITQYTQAIQTYLQSKFKNNKGSLKLLHGTARISIPKDKIVYDKDLCLKYLQEHKLDKYISYKADINKMALKKDASKVTNGLAINGEMVPGITFEPQPVKLQIESNNLDSATETKPQKIDTEILSDIDPKILEGLF